MLRKIGQIGEIYKIGQIGQIRQFEQIINFGFNLFSYADQNEHSPRFPTNSPEFRQESAGRRAFAQALLHLQWPPRLIR